MLDLELQRLGHTLDDLMAVLYEEYALTGRKYLNDDVRRAAVQLAGDNLSTFFDAHVTGTAPLALDSGFVYPR